MHHLEQNNIHVAVLQETKYTSKSKQKPTPNYQLIRKDRGNNIKGGGLAFIIHDTVPFKIIHQTAPKDDHLEEFTIVVNNGKNPLHIKNVYLPPASSCAQGYNPPFQSLKQDLQAPFLVLGDFHAHHPSWACADTEDDRGRQLDTIIAQDDLCVLNDENTHTRVQGDTKTSPDISLASPNITTACDWSTKTALSSDHLPIHVSIASTVTKTKAPNRTFINFNKADWDGFKNYIEEAVSSPPQTENVHKHERFLREVINTAAKIYIPAGRIHKVHNALPSDIAKLMADRDELRTNDPSNPSINNLNHEINDAINTHRRDKWLSHLEQCEPKNNRLWKTIKSLSSGPPTPINQGISFNNATPIDNPRSIANKFNQQYTPKATTKATKSIRHTLRTIRKKATLSSSNSPFIISPTQTLNAIKKSKNSKALGPDNISPIMIKHLGPTAITYITSIFNKVINQSIIPPLWKVGRIIPLLKPGKPSDQGTSYRPISLLSPLAKILESIILPHLQSSITLQPHQHGFRKGHSTCTALHSIMSHIKEGLNKQKPVNRTVLVAVDLSKAFDTVDHEILIDDITKLPLDPVLQRFICAYLRGRQTFVEFRGSRSKYRKVKQGVPQGGVLSPTLFNLYMSKLPLPPPEIGIVTYADDATTMCSGPDIKVLCKRQNKYLEELNNWFKSRNLSLSAPKSSATLFTTASQEVKTVLPITIDNTPVPTVQDPKILGARLDPLLTFKNQVKDMKDKVKSRNNILKALAGSDWGKDKETLTATYKAIGQSVTNYCAPIWTPTVSHTNWESLQVGQNEALRTITGSYKASSLDHLHAECKIMPVKEHSELLSKQFLLATQKPDHPNQCDLDHVPERIMKETLVTRFKEDVSRHVLTNGNNEAQHKIGIRAIHTDAVRDVLLKAQPSKVLHTQPPEIHKDEKLLPRGTRCKLAQLRSGYSNLLNTYKHRLDPNHTADCPQCETHPHTTEHLFSCRANPTDLTPLSLWAQPRAAATFLGLETDRVGVG